MNKFYNSLYFLSPLVYLVICSTYDIVVENDSLGKIMVEVGVPFLMVSLIFFSLCEDKYRLKKKITMLSNRVRDLTYTSMYDDTTGLPNRRLFKSKLSDMFNRYTERPRPQNLLYIDLNNFKCVNDTFGHMVGDVVLREAATRLRSCIRPGDMVARMGGDEFAVLIDGNADTARLVMRRMVSKFPSNSIRIDAETRFTVGVSIGAVKFSNLALNPEELIKVADRAMYQAKYRCESSSLVSGHAWGRLNKVTS